EYIHHVPLSHRQIAENSGENLSHTKKCLEQAFGGIVPAVWGDMRSGCDYRACEEGCLGPWK
ncbi:hypothetical protein, partial [Paraburkholderia tropica]|uniref:hypothetical protein n=1 Tax=Paraburkholderia tropica TaxID=92647 RepID=UPI002AB2A48D